MVSEKEYLRLREYAETQELSMSEILRDYLKSLPDTQPLGLVAKARWLCARTSVNIRRY
jgi:hypothetical protein